MAEGETKFEDGREPEKALSFSYACTSCSKRPRCLQRLRLCSSCERPFCSRCLLFFLQDESATAVNADHFSWRNCVNSLNPCCSKCFPEASALNRVVPEPIIQGSTPSPSLSDNSTLLILHGGHLSHASMLPLRDAIVDRNIFAKVVLVELPGHGTRYREPLTADTIEATIRNTMDGIRGPVWIFGHSLGGYIAYQAAATNTQIVGVITSGASVWNPMPMLFRVLLMLTKAMPPIEQHKMMLKYEFGACKPVPSGQLVWKTVAGVGQFWRVIDDMKKWLRAATVREWINELNARSIPILLVNGKNDSVNRVRNAKAMTKQFDCVQLKVLKGNHMVPIVQSEVVAQQIQKFCTADL